MSTPGFVRFDYVVAEATQARAFHTKLFGWTLQRYIALLPGGPQKPHWLAYLQVGSAHEAAGKAKQLGGKVLREPFTHDGGKLAIALDPANNVIAFWQPDTVHDVGWAHGANEFCWAELYTTSPLPSATFMKKVAGFAETKLPMADGNYHMFERGGAPHAGARKPMPGMPTGWFAWVSVDNVDAIVEHARSLGATITQPPADMPNGARMALLVDPLGVALGVIKSA